MALDDGQQTLSYLKLHAEVAALAAQLREHGVRVLASLADNSPAWVVVDRAAAEAGIVHVPLPAFFTREQCLHALTHAGCDALLATQRVAAGQVSTLDGLTAAA